MFMLTCIVSVFINKNMFKIELQLNRANSSDTEAPFLDLSLCVSNGTVSARLYDGGAILILMWSISLFWVAVSPGVPRVGHTCLSLLGSPELLRVLVALAAVVGPLLPGFLGGAVVILNFVGRFRGFVADAVPCWRNIASVWGRFCGGVCRSQGFAVTWCADLEELWVGLTFRNNSGSLLTVIKQLAVAWVLCGRLRAWLSARSLLVAVLRSSVARRRFGPQTQ